MRLIYFSKGIICFDISSDEVGLTQGISFLPSLLAVAWTILLYLYFSKYGKTNLLVPLQLKEFREEEDSVDIPSSEISQQQATTVSLFHIDA